MYRWVWLYTSLVIVALIFAGCVAVMPTAQVTYPLQREQSEVVTSVLLLLQEYNFTAVNVEAEAGFIVAELEKRRPSITEITGTYKGFEKIRLSIVIDGLARKFTVKFTKSSLYGRPSRWHVENFRDDERQMLRGMVTKIVTKLGGSESNIIWEGLETEVQTDRPAVRNYSSKRFIAIAGSIALTVCALSIFFSSPSH